MTLDYRKRSETNFSTVVKPYCQAQLNPLSNTEIVYVIFENMNKNIYICQNGYDTARETDDDMAQKCSMYPARVTADSIRMPHHTFVDLRWRFPTPLKKKNQTQS